MTDEMFADNDMSAGYMAHRVDMGGSSAAERLLGRVRRRNPEDRQLPPAVEPEKTAGQTTLAVAKDVGEGVIETPLAVLHGMQEAVNGVLGLTKEAADWLEEKIPLGAISTEGYVSPDEAKERGGARGPKLDVVQEPDSVTGNIISDVTQFLVGFKGVDKALRASKVARPTTAAGRIGEAAIKGTIAEFAVFDGQEGNLADLVQDYPALENPVTEFLATDPTDSEAVSRLKNAMTGTIVGAGADVAIEGMVKALRVMRAARKARTEKTAQPEEVRQRAEEKDFELLGDVSDEAPLLGERKIARAMDETGQVAPADINAPARSQTDNGLVFTSDGVSVEVDAVGDAWRVRKLEEGASTRLLEHAAREAIREGKTLESGRAVTATEQEAWESLERAGFPVEKSTSAQGRRNGTVSTPLADTEFYTLDGKRVTADPDTPHGTAIRILANPKQFDFDSVMEALQDAGQVDFARQVLSEVDSLKGRVGFERGGGEAVYRISELPEQTYINFARINAPEDVQNVMQEVADRMKGSVDEARRGRQTFREIELNAEQVDAWDTLMTRREGQPLNAEQSVAARQLWAESAEKLGQVARAAADSPSETNLFMFRKMLATHHAIQSEVIAARTETARALASWRIPAGTGAERFRDIAGAVEMSGGPDISRDLARRVAALSDAGYHRELSEFTEKSVYVRGRDALAEAWIMALLSGPKTHMVNILSNTSVLGMQMYERKTAAAIARLLGDETGVQAGEAMAQYSGLVDGLKDAFRNAWKSAKTGETGYGMGKIDVPMRGALSSEAFQISNTGWVGKAVDGIGSIVRVPGRALAAGDEFFKTIGYRMEVHAQAVRMANQEVTKGVTPPERLKERIAEIISDPPENIRLAGVDAATYQTFTDKPGKLAQSIQRLRGQYPALLVLLPFVRTPARILNFTFERTPLAPMMRHVREDIAAGGARRDLALARIGTGTAVMLATADLAMNGHITGTGPVDPREKQTLYRQGWQPSSIKFGDRYFAYNRMDPLGATIGIAADMVEILHNTDWDNEDGQDQEAVAVAIAASIGSNVMNKTYLTGLAEFFEAMGDPRRNADSFAQRFAGSVVPAGVSEIARYNDPYMREVGSMLDAMRRRTPGLSDDLPVRRDLWGRPVSYESGIGWAYDAFSPIYSRRKNPEPIDEELVRLEYHPSMPMRNTSFRGATINMSQYPEAYSRYVELAGNELKHPAFGLGAKDLLNAIVQGNHPLSQVYEIKTDGPDGGKALMIQDLLNRYREMARRQVLDEFPEIRARVEDKQQRRRDLRMPSIG